MRSALFFAMVAVCFIALQCTADEANKPGEQSNPVSSPDAPSAPSDLIGQPAAGANTDGKQNTGAGGTGALSSDPPPPPPPAAVPPGSVPPVVPGSTGGSEEDRETGAKDVAEVKDVEDVKDEVENDVVVNQGSEGVDLSNSHGTGGGKGVSGPNAGTELAHGTALAPGGTGPAGPSGHAVPDASVAGDEIDQKKQGSSVPGGVAGVASGGQGNTSIPGADNGGAGVPSKSLSPSGPDPLDSGKDKGKKSEISSVGTGTGGGGVGAAVGGTGIGSIHRVNSSPPTTKAGIPNGHEGTPSRDASSGTSGNKDLSPALPSPTTKDTNTQTAAHATSVQTLKSSTSTAAPTDSTQKSVTSTTKSARKETTAPGNPLPNLSKTLQSVDNKDGNMGSSSLFAFTALVTLVVMAVAPAF